MTAAIITGSILIVIVLCIVAAKIFDHMFYSTFRRRAQQIRNEAGFFDNTPVRDKDLEHLPTPVSKYLTMTGLTGKNGISFAQIIHGGSMRISAERSFIPVKGEYFLTTKHPSFCWFGKVMLFGIPVSAFDSYFNGSGRMVIKLLSFFKLADARSKETSFSAFGRCIAELSMAPSFFLDKERITWTAFDHEKAFCTITDAGMSLKAEMYFHPEGLLDRIVIQRYFDRGNGKFSLEKFTGQASVYKEFQGVSIPSVLDGYWNLEEGDLHYVHFIITEAVFD